MNFDNRDINRFLCKTDRSTSVKGCWLWTASKTKKGYGKFGLLGLGWEQAHRVSYLMFRGEIPQSLCVLHTCDNSSCVNPAHLFLGTVIKNNQDMMSKGRHVHGSTNFLTDEKVKEIRIKLALGQATGSLASEYGMSDATISMIKHNKTWKV